MVTLKDIAEHVGCNVSTISRVVNGKMRRQNTRNYQLIQQAIKELGYVRNETARTLVSGRSHNIGLIIQSSESLFSLKLQNAIMDAFLLHGFMTICVFSESDEQCERKWLECFLSKRVDALILCRLRRQVNADVVEQYHEFDIPVIGIGEQRDVAFDEKQVMELAVSALGREHPKRLGYVRYMRQIAGTGQERGKILQDILTEQQYHSFANEYCIRDFSDALQLAAKFRTSAPEALICCNDPLADMMIKAMSIQKISVPGDIEVIGIDGVADPSFMMHLTTIRLPVEKIADSIWRIFHKKENFDHTILVEPELIIGESTKHALNQTPVNGI